MVKCKKCNKEMNGELIDSDADGSTFRWTCHCGMSATAYHELTWIPRQIDWND